VDSLVVLPRNGQSSCNRSKTCVVGNGGEDGSIQEVELSEKPPDYFSVHNNGNSSCYTNSEVCKNPDLTAMLLLCAVDHTPCFFLNYRLQAVCPELSLLSQ